MTEDETRAHIVHLQASLDRVEPTLLTALPVLCDLVDALEDSARMQAALEKHGRAAYWALYTVITTGWLRGQQLLAEQSLQEENHGAI